MSERIYIEEGVFQSWCKMRSSEIMAAEMSDLRDSERRNNSYVDTVASELRTAVDELTEQIKQQGKRLHKHASALTANEERLNASEVASQRVAAALERGGSLQQVFQQIATGHLERINARIGAFETQVAFAIRNAEEKAALASEHARDASSSGAKAETLLARVRESSEQLCIAANGLATDMASRGKALEAQTINANEFLKSLQQLEAASRQAVERATRLAGMFEHYKGRAAAWGSFWGRVKWLIFGMHDA